MATRMRLTISDHIAAEPSQANALSECLFARHGKRQELPSIELHSGEADHAVRVGGESRDFSVERPGPRLMEQIDDRQLFPHDRLSCRVELLPLGDVIDP